MKISKKEVKPVLHYKYYTVMRGSKDPKFLRYRMVVYAIDYGNKPAARIFFTTVKTVRKWRKRYKAKGYEGLESLSRRPKSSPNRTPEERREYIRSLKKKYKRVGALEVKHILNLPENEKTIRKIWKEEGGKVRKRRRKHQTKRNLREVKKKWALFEQIDEDTKDLKDIPEYWIQMMDKKLPTTQYTARDVTSGMTYISFSSTPSMIYSALFGSYVNNHLIENGINLSKTRRQTDNGSEFIGSWNAKKESLYTRIIQGIDGQIHITIPPGAHRFQSDVETFHNLIEMQFYEIETFDSMQDFLEKAFSYVAFFNLVRPNSYKENKTPFQIAKEKNPNVTEKIAFLPPIFLDEIASHQINKYLYLCNGGYDVRTTP